MRPREKEATKLVDSVYKDELAAAKSPEQKRALAQKLFKAADETRNDPAGRYVLLLRARDLAIDSGNVATALSAVGQLGQSFQIDSLATDADAVTRLAKSAKTPDDFRSLLHYANGGVNEAVAAERFDAARRLAEAAASVAGKANDPAFAKATAGRVREIKEVEAGRAAAQQAMATLSQKADDPAANLAVGRYRCLLKGDWAAGLPHLAAGGDDTLRRLAQKDLAGPATADAQLAVADGWWDLAEKSQGLSKTHLQLRARTWYETAAASLAGLSRAKAEQRVEGDRRAGPRLRPQVGRGCPGARPRAAPPEVATSKGPKEPKENKEPKETKETQLPQGRFTREWTEPQEWVGKPEQVTVSGTKISVSNQGGTNVVYANADLVKEKDGSISVTWNKGPAQQGYEIWSGSGKDLIVSRWDSKSEKDSGRPAKRVGRVVVK